MAEQHILKDNVLDANEWPIMELPLGDGTVYTYAEPDAKVTPFENGIELRVDKFTHKGLPNMQQTDTGKHFYMSKTKHAFPKKGKIKFSADMAAETLGMNGQNYQDAFVLFNLADFDNAMMYDSVTTGNRFHAIYEKLIIPGKVKPEDSYTFVVDDPYVAAPNPLEWHNHSVVFDIDEKLVTWFVDDRKIFEVLRKEPLPTALQFGIGLFTFKPYINGESVSIQGQGMLGRWKNLKVETFQ